MRVEPIFIVGVPRSGTTLLAAMLAAHSRMSCGPETHFFQWLARADIAQLCRADFWPGAALDFVCGMTHANRAVCAKYGLTRDDIATYLEGAPPKVASLLAALTEPYMAKLGKQRWVEKTPDHLKYVAEMRRHFPHSPIVRIVRDPRDVALSLKRMPWGPQTWPGGLLWWKQFDDASAAFFASDPLSYTLRYEDLVRAPAEELRQLCHFLGEEFEEQMLDTSTTGRQLNSRGVPEKARVSQPIDVSRVEVWRNELSQRENQLAESLLGDRLRAFAYPVEGAFPRYAEIYPPRTELAPYVDELTRLAEAGIRFWRAYDREHPTVKVYLGLPHNWFVGNRRSHLRGALTVLRDVAVAAMGRNSVFWAVADAAPSPSGHIAYWLTRLLRPFAMNRHGFQYSSTQAGARS